MRHNRACQNQNGYIAVITILLLLVLLGTGLAYLKWSTDESVEFKRQFAVLTAYYMAQSAMSQDIIPYLSDLTGTYPEINLSGTPEKIDYDLPPGMDGEYSWHAEYVASKSSQTAYGGTKFYNVEVTGKINYTPFNSETGELELIEVDTTIYIQWTAANTWGIFMYLTNYETTIFEEKIKFFDGDTLWGRVHSNDQIAIMESPVFYERVSTCARTFWEGDGYNPIFYKEPWFEVDPVYFPTSLSELRAGAAAQGKFITLAGYQFRVIFQGTAGITIMKWPLGLPYSDSLATPHAQYPPQTDGAIFIDGTCQVLGTDPEAQAEMGVVGRVSLGCSGDMWLMDNIQYEDNFSMITGQIDSSTANMLGLMSESNVLIKNTWENGRDNGVQVYPADSWRNSIVISAGIVALGESFSFEDQNDVIEMSGLYPEWYISNGPSPDERGQIHLWGQVSQYRRGYVHRSNHGGTGYLKDYHYDERFYWDPPPFYPYLDESHGVDRDILAWGVGHFPREPEGPAGNE